MTTTYGIIKHTNETKKIMTTGFEFKAPCFVGIGGAYTAKEYKTLIGADRVATKYGASVMRITDGVMNY